MAPGRPSAKEFDLLRESRTRFMRYRYWIILAPLVVTLAVYGKTVGYGFVDFDDTMYVVNNLHVQAGLTWDGMSWALTSFYAGNWHPLTWLSHMVDCTIFGMAPGRFHFTNVLLHLVITTLLFVLFIRMTGALWRSVFSAKLFALHPLHVESVACISERKDLLSTFFLLLTLLGYRWYVASPHPGRYVTTLCLFALGLMAKPMLVTVPFILLLLDWWPLGRCRSRSGETFKENFTLDNSLPPVTMLRLVSEKIPFLILSLFSSIVTIFAQRAGGALISLQTLSPGERISGLFEHYAWYLVKLVWPVKLAFYYPVVPHDNFLQTSGAVFLVVGISLLTLWQARRFPAAAVGWCWFLVTLVPVIGLVAVGMQSTADRYTYIPYIGLFTSVVWLVPELLKNVRFQREIMGIAAVAITLMLTCCTWQQVEVWRNSFTLSEHALQVTTGNFMAHSILGNYLDDNGRADEAIVHLREAIRIKPTYEIVHNSLGTVLFKQGKQGEAMAHFSRAIQLNPGYADAHINMGVCLAQLGRFQEAKSSYLTALRLNPDHPDARYNLELVEASLAKLRVTESVRPLSSVKQ